MAPLATRLCRRAAVAVALLVYACAVVPAQAQRFADYEHEERAPRYIPSASDAHAARPTPVPILKQVNRHNEDGSYTYGYESADGSFKIETKLANGEVKGKYGYRDDTGKVRTIEYGANQYGFQPSGEGITVAPPTLVDESRENRRQEQPQGGRAPAQYRPAPVDYDYEEPAQAPQPAPAPYRAPAVAARQQQLHTFAAASAPTAPRRPVSFAGAAPAPLERVPAQFSSGAEPAAAAPRGAPEPQFQFSQTFQPHNQLQFSAPAPRKQYPAQQYQAQQYQPQQYQPQQQYSAPAPQSVFRPAAQAQREPFSMLDKLIQEYGLPQGGSKPLHDITFGSY